MIWFNVIYFCRCYKWVFIGDDKNKDGKKSSSDDGKTKMQKTQE